MGTTRRDLSRSRRTAPRELERSRRVSTKDFHDHSDEDSSRTSRWFNPIGTNSVLSKWTRSLWITLTVSCLDSQSLLDRHRRRETSQSTSSSITSVVSFTLCTFEYRHTRLSQTDSEWIDLASAPRHVAEEWRSAMASFEYQIGRRCFGLLRRRW